MHIDILSVGELPSHNHTAWTGTSGGHSHTFALVDDETRVDNYAAAGASYQNATGSTTWNGDHSHTVGINNTGSNQSHNNMMPYIAIYIWQRIA